MQNRRSVLASIGSGGVAVLAGCAGGESDSTPTATPTPETSLTDIIGIPSHEWVRRSMLQVTVENRTEDVLDLVQVEANLYVDNTRIGHSYTNISSLPGGTTVNSAIQFIEGFDQEPCNATRYDLFPNFYYDSQQFEERMEYEYDPGFCG